MFSLEQSLYAFIKIKLRDTMMNLYGQKINHLDDIMGYATMVI